MNDNVEKSEGMGGKIVLFQLDERVNIEVKNTRESLAYCSTKCLGCS